MKIPITIITGYLGAGKTTLLRRIASESKVKIAILMNEFGEIAIDSKIIKGKNIEMAELSGGCVCCSLSGEFEAAVAEILEIVRPEWIIVETTGVAEPAALANDVVENIPDVKLDAIITLIDADSMVRYPSLGHTGMEQIELADVEIVNKIDLVSKDELEKIISKIKSINDRASIIETKQAQVSMEVIFGIERKEKIACFERPGVQNYQKCKAFLAKPKHKTHKLEFEYFDFVIDKKIDHNKFILLVEKLPKEIYRLKGFFVSEKGSFLLNYVAGRFSLEKFDTNKTELVFIGKGIGKIEKEIISKLNKCQ